LYLAIKPFNRRGRDPEAVAIFIEALKDIDKDVKVTALRKLEDFSNEAFFSKVDMDPDICRSIATILDDPDQYLRYLAVRMLENCRVKSIEDKLLHTADDNKESLKIREIALRNLAKSNIKGLDEKLIRFLKDESEDKEIKRAAIYSLGKLKSFRAVDIIIPYLYDKDRQVHYTAAIALGNIGDPKASNALGDVIIDSKGGIDSFVLKSLEKIGSPEVLPKLLEIKPLLTSRNLKRDFVRALGATGSDSAVEPLLSFIIEDSDDAVQSSASQILGRFESQTALKTIIDASKKEPGNPYLSSLAKKAQRRLDFPEEALERKKKEQERNIVLEQEREINKIYNTGHRLFRDKKYEKALPYFLEAVDKYEKLYTSYPAYFRSSLNQIRRIRNTLAGYYRWKIKSPEKAITEYMKLISTVNKFETDERRTSHYWFTLGEVYEKDLKDYQKALDCYKKFSELAQPKDKGHDRNEEILYKWYIDWIAFLQEKIRVIYLKKQQAFSHRTLKYPNMEYGFSTASLGLAFVFTEADFANEFDEEILNPVNNNTYNSIEVLDKFYAKYPDSYRVMFFGTGLFHHCLEENKIDDALLVAEKLIKYYPYDINTLMLQFEVSDIYKTQKNNQKHKEAINKGLKMAKSMNIDIVLSPDQRFSSPDKTMQQFVESLKEGKLWDDLSKEEIKELDILLKKKCKEMSTALEQNDIDKAVSYFYSKSREKYRKGFSVLPPEIRKKIAKEFANIRFCEMPSPSNAIYELLSERDGKTYSFQLTFIRDFDGKWYIYQF
jgi:HEAT repeat protein